MHEQQGRARVGTCDVQADGAGTSICRHASRTGLAESTVNANGRTTVPAAIRSLVDAKPGTRMVWSVMRYSIIIVRAKSTRGLRQPYDDWLLRLLL
jgi:hypothetical protein